jgi:hypothetical protein
MRGNGVGVTNAGADPEGRKITLDRCGHARQIRDEEVLD